jgi:hypothetical protein
MPKLLSARPARNKGEDKRVRQLADARRAPADSVLFARIVQLSWGGVRVPAIAALVGCHPRTVRRCLHQFNTTGLRGLVLCRVKAVDTIRVPDCYL